MQTTDRSPRVPAASDYRDYMPANSSEVRVIGGFIIGLACGLLIAMI